MSAKVLSQRTACFTLFLLFGLMISSAQAQESVVAAEYQIDSSTAYSLILNATSSYPSSPTTSLVFESVFSATVDTSDLSMGPHYLSLRFEDSDDVWSFWTDHPWGTEWFRVTGDQHLTGAEWYIDTDPGEGLGTAIALRDDGAWDEEVEEFTLENIETSGLSVGEHTLYLRTQDADGNWSRPHQCEFEVGQELLVRNAEWVNDPDTPVGSGTPLSAVDGVFDSTEEALVSDPIDPSQFPVGAHPVLYVRVQDNLNFGVTYTGTAPDWFDRGRWSDEGGWTLDSQVTLNRCPYIVQATPSNENPVILTPGAMASFIVEATDDDWDPLSYEFLLDDATESLTNEFIYSVTDSDLGEHAVQFMVSDASCSDIHDWVVQVYTPTVTPTPTSTGTPTPLVTNTYTQTPTVTETPTITATSTNTPTSTSTETPTSTTTASPTPTPKVHFSQNKYIFTIERDYEQQGLVTVLNEDVETHQVWVELPGAQPDDLVLGFTGQGSQDTGYVDLAGGANLGIRLMIHAPDALQEVYTFTAQLHALVGGEEQTSEAEIEIRVNFPDVLFTLEEINTLDCSLTKQLRVYNQSETINDLRISAGEDLSDFVIFQPHVEHGRLYSGGTLNFSVIPDLGLLLDDPEHPTGGYVYASAGGVTEELYIDFVCSGGNSLYEATLYSQLITCRMQDWYCTNKPSFQSYFNLPSGFSVENIQKADLAVYFEPRSGWVHQPHNLRMLINGHEVASITNTVPSGAYEFEIPLEDPDTGLPWSPFIIPESGVATNVLKLEMFGMNPGHYVVASDFQVVIAIDQASVTACAPNMDEAINCLNYHGYFEPQPASWDILDMAVQDKQGQLVEDCGFAYLGSPYIVSATVADPSLPMYMVARPDNGDEAFLLEQQLDGTYQGQWIPGNDSIHPDDHCIVYLYAGACHNGSATACVTLSPGPLTANFEANPLTGSPPLCVQFTDLSFNGPPESWLWDFGDGNSSTEQHPLHCYESEGVYSVILSVTDSNEEDSMAREDYVFVSVSTPTSTPTNTPTMTPTGTNTGTPTVTPTRTPLNTSTNTPTITSTWTPSYTPTVTGTSTPTPTVTETPTVTLTATPTITTTPVNTATNTPTVTPTSTPQVWEFCICTNQPIPLQLEPVIFEINIQQMIWISGFDIGLRLQHPNHSHLRIVLQGPCGQQTTIWNPLWGNNEADLDLEIPLTLCTNQCAQGTWQLLIYNEGRRYSGTLNEWRMRMRTKLMCDLDNDKDVDSDDMLMLIHGLEDQSPGDFNLDSRVDRLDIFMMGTQWGRIEED